MNTPYDVAIVGGGPGGSTTGTLLKKYRPNTSVLILERERFPREHIGESLLPAIGPILDEMGVWDKVEAANFPIKLGGTYLWGQSSELWDLNFYEPAAFVDEPRPAKFVGQRHFTAFQVDRSIYDDILLRHAEQAGCEVREGTPVRDVLHRGDRVDGLRLHDGSTVTARHYVDASGNSAIIRRAFRVGLDIPTRLMNIAIWDYWTNTEWAERIGVGGTRIQVISIGFGWLWFIPLGATRTSLGLVCPVEYYKSSGRTPEELYEDGIAASPRITELVRHGTRDGKIRTTNDWSYVSARTVGENWMLVGESAGFADPILSAGVTLTHAGGREAAYTLRALLDGTHDRDWLLKHYHDNQTRRVRQHMSFAEFWYAANGQFIDLQRQCSEIARESGLTLQWRQAWQWLAQGGFSNDLIGSATIGGFPIRGLKLLTREFTKHVHSWEADHANVFRLNLEGAVQERIPYYQDGKIHPVLCHVRDGRRLPVVLFFERALRALAHYSDAVGVFRNIDLSINFEVEPARRDYVRACVVEALEAMIGEGWVVASHDPAQPSVDFGRHAKIHDIRHQLHSPRPLPPR